LRIYIGNLSFDTTEENLETQFAAHGNVRSVSIIRDRQTGRSRGFGFVEMDDDQEASAALTALNGTELDGRALTVNEARPRTGRSGGDWGRGESQGRGQRW
jgi:RNA recognition motif-containing protein